MPPRLSLPVSRLLPGRALATALLLALPALGPVPATAQRTLPADPAPAAPRPPDLNRQPLPSTSLPQPGIALPRGMEALPGGGWRLNGALARGTLDAPAQAALAEIARWLAQSTTGRVTVLAQVAGPEDDLSVARRESLAHGLAIRQTLEQAGLDGTRIDTRPLGRTAEARDSIEVLPPATQRAAPGDKPGAVPGATQGEHQRDRQNGAPRQP